MTRIGENPPRALKRFYAKATAEEADGAFQLRLDGKPAKTRHGRALASPSAAFGAAIADEWNAQKEFIQFAAMPMTRLLMTVIDLGETDAAAWRDALRSFLKSELLCYRAHEPATLVARQADAFDPLLDWASDMFGIELTCSAGVSFVEQPARSIAAGERAFGAAGVPKLLGMKAAAEISGSAIIALALAEKAFAAEHLFEVSRVDERFQSERWGNDQEAQARDAQMKKDFLDAARFLDLL